MIKFKTTLLAFGCALWLPFAAVAADFDGSKTLICTPIDAAECLLGPTCLSVTMDDLNLPQFFTLDFKAKQLRGRVPSGTVEKTTIQNVRKVDGRTILQGAENGRGWSIVINQNSGRMSATVAALSENDERVGFVMLGSCTPDP